MDKWKFSRAFKKIFSLATCLVLILLFQNCGSFVDEIEQSSNDVDQAQAAELPFAYDLSIDRIAYMSCKGEGFHAAGEPFFSFKAGAYDAENGVGLNANFLKNFGGLSSSRTVELLGLSPRNKDAGVVMSVREENVFQEPLEFGGDPSGGVGSGASPQLGGLLYDPGVFVNLTTDVVSQFLANQNGKPANYLQGLPGTRGKTFDAEIRLFQAEDTAADEQFRNFLQDSAFLSFTFAIDNLSSPGLKARSPFDPLGEAQGSNSSVFGKGYQFSFAQFNSSRSSSAKRAVTSVRGANLETGSSLGEDWVCPESERYIIVRSQDALRRYDAAPFDVSNPDANHPLNEFDETADTDGDPGTVPTTVYDDGGDLTGGYYYSFLKDLNGDGQQETVRQKVICPTTPDDILVGNSEHTDAAWKRIRELLPAEDWFVYRGAKYNCIVPKNTSGDVCYGGDEIGNADTPLGSENRRLLQYFPDEDFPNRRINTKREGGPEAPRTTDCGPGSNAICPHILSVCHRRN